jgi:hypothetical protein
MWARLNDNDTIAQLYMRPVGITLNGVQYPASIFSLWSASELRALKIWSVTMTNSPSDQKYYNNSSPVYAVTKDADDNVTGVTGTYTITEKPLKDVYTIPVASSDGFSDGDKIASSANHSSAGKTGNIISKETGKLHVEVTKGNWANGNTVRGIKPDGTGALSPAVSTTISGDLSLHSRGLQWSKIEEVKDMQGAKLQPYDWYVVRKADDGTAIPSAVQTYRDGVRTKATAHETAVSATTNVTELIAVNIGDGWPDEPST